MAEFSSELAALVFRSWYCGSCLVVIINTCAFPTVTNQE